MKIYFKVTDASQIIFWKQLCNLCMVVHSEVVCGLNGAECIMKSVTNGQARCIRVWHFPMR